MEGDSVPAGPAVDATMHIGELAERTQLSLRTIRHYDEVGLLKPAGRTDGGFRLYTEDDVSRLLLIRRMKPLGFSLEEMSELLALIAARDASPSDAPPPRQDELERFIDLTVERRAKLEGYLARADELLELLHSR